MHPSYFQPCLHMFMYQYFWLNEPYLMQPDAWVLWLNIQIEPKNQTGCENYSYVKDPNCTILNNGELTTHVKKQNQISIARGLSHTATCWKRQATSLKLSAHGYSHCISAGLHVIDYCISSAANKYMKLSTLNSYYIRLELGSMCKYQVTHYS